MVASSSTSSRSARSSPGFRRRGRLARSTTVARPMFGVGRHHGNHDWRASAQIERDARRARARVGADLSDHARWRRPAWAERALRGLRPMFDGHSLFASGNGATMGSAVRVAREAPRRLSGYRAADQRALGGAAVLAGLDATRALDAASAAIARDGARRASRSDGRAAVAAAAARWRGRRRPRARVPDRRSRSRRQRGCAWLEKLSSTCTSPATSTTAAFGVATRVDRGEVRTRGERAQSVGAAHSTALHLARSRRVRTRLRGAPHDAAAPPPPPPPPPPRCRRRRSARRAAARPAQTSRPAQIPPLR